MMMSRKRLTRCGSWATGLATTSGLLIAGNNILLAQPAGNTAEEAAPAIASETLTPPYSPPVRFSNEDTNLYWGDTHVHTNNSADAFGLGNATIDPEDAFRFATGQEITGNNGMRVKLRRPLDFLAVADHAEYLGVFPRLASGAPTLNWERGRRWAALLRSGDLSTPMNEFFAILGSGDSGANVPPEIAQSIWNDVASTADRFNDPGHFTAFIGYEWSSTPSGDNLHRNVIFRDGADKATQIVPFSGLDSENPEDLWAFLRGYEAETGGEVLAIPHNGNLSSGRMFAPQTFTGQPFTVSYARERARWEPVVEVTQTKGTGEAHPTLAATDEFADFEIWDRVNVQMNVLKLPWMLRYEYARTALRDGLRHEQTLGANPFKFGMIGSTDTHVGISTTTEDNFFGKLGGSEPSPDRSTRPISQMPYTQFNWQIGASGLAAVWATENTREAIFDAFRRREVYATTGSRIQLRFFGGWNFTQLDLMRPDYARIGYARGVPMGGDLMHEANTGAPSFMIVAAKDPDEANLDRVQVIKGWVDALGRTHERIYDVALSDGRRVDPRSGRAPPVGNTVDVRNATYSNSIGDPELATLWTDPDFNPSERAFYYVRVLEIPKPRWTAYDARFFRLTLPAGVPMTVQDRAYSSPIWYNP